MAIDGRWSSPKYGIHGTVSAVDSVNHEVLAFSTETKKGKNRVNGKYEGSSNQMETVGTSNVLQILKDDNTLSKTSSICKDGDNPSQKVYKEKNCDQLIVYDPNHFRKSFKKAVDKLVKEYSSFSYINAD